MFAARGAPYRERRGTRRGGPPPAAQAPSLRRSADRLARETHRSQGGPAPSWRCFQPSLARTWCAIREQQSRSCLRPARPSPPFEPGALPMDRCHRPTSAWWPRAFPAPPSSRFLGRHQGRAAFPCRRSGISAATTCPQTAKPKVQAATVEQPHGLFGRLGVADCGIGQRHGGTLQNVETAVAPTDLRDAPKIAPTCPRLSMGNLGQREQEKTREALSYRGFLGNVCERWY